MKTNKGMVEMPITAGELQSSWNDALKGADC